MTFIVMTRTTGHAITVRNVATVEDREHYVAFYRDGHVPVAFFPREEVLYTFQED